jgi:hypothetical protein
MLKAGFTELEAFVPSDDIGDINEMIGVAPECEPYHLSLQRIKTALKKPVKVYVKWDPVLEEVICVHSTEDSACEKCIAVYAKNINLSYVAGDWFDVIEDAPTKQ